MNWAKRSNVIFVSGVLLVITIVVMSYLFVVAGRPPPGGAMLPGVAPPPSPAAEFTARLVRATGDVQVRNGARDWQAAANGAALAAGTQLRAGEDAKAELVVGDDVHIDVTAGTDVQLGTFGPDLARLVVGEGLVLADVRRGRGQRLQISNRSGEAVTETADGAVAVTADAAGRLRTAVTRGSATLAANGETVTVGAGFFSVAGRGNKPSKPAAVPQSLFLKVKWPGVPATAQRQQTISGATSPGARVRVSNRLVWADAKGRFQTIVDLQEGKNRIQVRAVDLVGRETHDASPEIELHTMGPTQKIETSPEMWR